MSMPYSAGLIGVINNPLVFSVYSARSINGSAPPPPEEGVRITQDSNVRITQDDNRRITE